jgi:hypothetical protein
MIFSDGECPNCGAHQLHLNTLDLLECPSCNLVCANRDGLVATVMPFLGNGNFRFEDCAIMPLQGTAFAKSEGKTTKSDLKNIFKTREQLSEYIATLSHLNLEKSEELELLLSFLSAFKEYFGKCEPNTLMEFWATKPTRTNFYREQAMPAIAEMLNLVHGNEEFKVDYVMAKRSNRGYLVPKIYIESENDFESADHEIKKLCSLNSPLRVLITVTQKNFSSDPASPAHQNLRVWQAVIQSHAEENPYFHGIIAVIVGQLREGAITFFSCAFRRNGDLLHPLTSLLTCPVSSPTSLSQQ